ncbi:unnamed protein product [Protopolystoma xenopodis]|uniref:Uncharacterized protein n=1 Tax=Protopolystoma xenopodis TaxID=117903 RepID=A0A448X323_9PLAT|nr:unnamed protein product [Protopolystoma xenopodis]
MKEVFSQRVAGLLISSCTDCQCFERHHYEVAKEMNRKQGQKSCALLSRWGDRHQSRGCKEIQTTAQQAPCIQLADGAPSQHLILLLLLEPLLAEEQSPCILVRVLDCTEAAGKKTSLGGLEPPTFRLTAERANRLRHRDDACHQPPGVALSAWKRQSFPSSGICLV